MKAIISGIFLLVFCGTVGVADGFGGQEATGESLSIGPGAERLYESFLRDYEKAAASLVDASQSFEVVGKSFSPHLIKQFKRDSFKEQWVSFVLTRSGSKWRWSQTLPSAFDETNVVTDDLFFNINFKGTSKTASVRWIMKKPISFMQHLMEMLCFRTSQSTFLLGSNPLYELLNKQALIIESAVVDKENPDRLRLIFGSQAILVDSELGSDVHGSIVLDPDADWAIRNLDWTWKTPSGAVKREIENCEIRREPDGNIVPREVLLVRFDAKPVKDKAVPLEWTESERYTCKFDEWKHVPISDEKFTLAAFGIDNSIASSAVLAQQGSNGYTFLLLNICAVVILIFAIGYKAYLKKHKQEAVVH